MKIMTIIKIVQIITRIISMNKPLNYILKMEKH